ncbi:MAG: acyl-CoA dehydrogenase family protein [Roseiarcus sp.]|jgi:acyl-CoA dehydrogenase
MSATISRLPIAAAPVARAGAPSLRARAAACAEIAARAADAVDSEARFPGEAIGALREARLLGILIPEALGGEGAGVAEVVDVCYALGAACASSAMIYAMHQIKVACLVRHGGGAPWQQGLQRRIAERQLLMASSTTEGANGGNLRASAAAVQTRGARIALERDASVISYGEFADGIVTTARRADSAAASDQVLLALLKDDYTLERTQSWDTLGMRGTCSAGFILRAQGGAEQVLPEPYERIHGQTMMPVAHLLWSAVWSGIAAGAAERARRFARKAARAAQGTPPPAAAQLTRARLSLETLRGAVQAAARKFERHAADPRSLSAIDVQVAMNLLKVEASELAVAVVMGATRACGLAGYRNDGEFAMGRYVRDILSAPIMINNDRILADTQAAAMMTEIPAFLSDH